MMKTSENRKGPMMGVFGQQEYGIRLEWGAQAIAHLAKMADCVVIVDVMSFSTCVSIAVDNRAEIYPWPWKDDSANAFAARHQAQVASPRHRFSEAGRYSLSPDSLKAISPGTRLVLPSPNGATLSLQARESHAVVLCGCLRNARATAEACRRFRSVLVVPCGERWPDGSLRVAVEDYVAAGAIVAAIGREDISPEAALAATAWEHEQARSLAGLYQCASAKELISRGFAPDVDLCLAVNVSDIACNLQGEVWKRIPPSSTHCRQNDPMPDV